MLQTPANNPDPSARPPVERIRISIPFWGDAYYYQVLGLTLPALMAPGNLPALAEEYSVEVALVTETRFFSNLRDSAILRLMKQHAEVKLVSLDDLLTNVSGDYGPVLTFALIRGYEDLRERMLDYFLMFLNADFILADGSYRTVAQLIKEGHQVIHCPSFRGVAEDIVPKLNAQVCCDSPVLAVAPREMMAIALKHKHVSVKARTINQRLYHQRYMDQFYWYVDENTLIGYQWPVALVGLRPERIVLKPRLMFDYGFIPEICPTAPKHYISDSDQFSMLELQERASGEETIEIGWMSRSAIAAYLSDYSTREQRECGEQMHVFHSRELPAELPTVAKESCLYIREIVSRLGPPKPHDNHPKFDGWWRGVLARMEARVGQDSVMNGAGCTRNPAGEQSSIGGGSTHADAESVPNRAPRSRLRGFARKFYFLIFGKAGNRKLTFPMWADTHLLEEALRLEMVKGGQILWVSTRNSALPENSSDTLVSLSFSELPKLHDCARHFDSCFFELTMKEFQEFSAAYESVRPHVRGGGSIFVNVARLDAGNFPSNSAHFLENAMPDKDVSELVFLGGRGPKIIRAIYLELVVLGSSNPILRRIVPPLTLLVLAPLAYVANSWGLKTKSAFYSPHWLSMLARFTVDGSGCAELGSTYEQKV